MWRREGEELTFFESKESKEYVEPTLNLTRSLSLYMAAAGRINPWLSVPLTVKGERPPRTKPSNEVWSLS